MFLFSSLLRFSFTLSLLFSPYVGADYESLIDDLLLSQSAETSLKKINLQINLWDIGYNAGAKIINERVRHIYISIPFLTEHFVESMATLCHEVGHHLGGAPFKPNHPHKLSVEGQADFYAPRCLRKFFEQFPEYMKFVNKEKIKPVKENQIKEICFDSFAGTSQEAICFSTIKSSYLLIELLSNWRGKPIPSLKFMEKKPADKTILTGYPTLQCRLDTFIKGALCQEYNFSQCERPSCWYKKL